jgi:hypothetical protein
VAVEVCGAACAVRVAARPCRAGGGSRNSLALIVQVSVPPDGDGSDAPVT